MPITGKSTWNVNEGYTVEFVLPYPIHASASDFEIWPNFIIFRLEHSCSKLSHVMAVFESCPNSRHNSKICAIKSKQQNNKNHLDDGQFETNEFCG